MQPPRFFRRRVVACTGIRYYAGMDAERIRLNIANVRKRVSIAAEKVQRRADDITLAPIRSGVGLRAGANVGYLAYSRQRNWIPF